MTAIRSPGKACRQVGFETPHDRADCREEPIHQGSRWVSSVGEVRQFAMVVGR